jgi:hypothetical protein
MNYLSDSDSDHEEYTPCVRVHSPLRDHTYEFFYKTSNRDHVIVKVIDHVQNARLAFKQENPTLNDCLVRLGYPVPELAVLEQDKYLETPVSMIEEKELEMSVYSQTVMVHQIIDMLKEYETTEHKPFRDQLRTEIETIAEEVLINSRGGIHLQNHSILEYNGFPVIPLEKDGFGWLRGGIRTKRGIIAFS